MTDANGSLKGLLVPVAIVALVWVPAILCYCLGKCCNIACRLAYYSQNSSQNQNASSRTSGGARRLSFRSALQDEDSSIPTLFELPPATTPNNHSLVSLTVFPNPDQLSVLEPAIPLVPLVPNRRNTLASISSSRSVDAYFDNPNERHNTPSQSSIVGPGIHQYHESPSSITAVSPPDNSTSFDDTFSVTTMSTVPPSYRSRRPEHEIEPRVLPPAYGASSESVAHPPPAFNSRGRVLRLHGSRSLRSVSTTVSGPRDSMSQNQMPSRVEVMDSSSLSGTLGSSYTM